jgi:hypothetical protein
MQNLDRALINNNQLIKIVLAVTELIASYNKRGTTQAVT